MLLLAAVAQAQIPRMQAVPLPYDEISFRRDGKELTRLHYSARMDRPFLYPVYSAKGDEMTRIGHPHDPHGHRHHYSLWFAATPVSGQNFWGDGEGRIRAKRVVKIDDGATKATVVLESAWGALLDEQRTISVIDLGGDWMIEMGMTLKALNGPVVFDAKGFGPVGVRMAKSIGVNDGGGKIVNSSGLVNGKAIFRQPARWVDYSGPVPSGLAGITLFDHPSNVQHPQAMHVRDDGWMGAVMTEKGAVTIPRGETITLRYGFLVHTGALNKDAVEAVWKAFAER